MSEQNQGVEEAPTIQLNPEIEYRDPELKALYSKQYPSAEQPEGEPVPDEEEQDEQEPKPEAKDIKNPKAPEPKKEEDTKEPTPEELVAKTVEAVKAEIPEPFHDYVDEYYKSEGKLSKDSLAKLKEEHGFDEKAVNAYIKTFAENFSLKGEAQSAKAEAQSIKSQQEADVFISQLHKQVGGEEAWNDMVEWAATEAPADVVERYNRLVEHPDPAVVQVAVENLHAAYKAAQPQEPQYLKTTETRKPGPTNRPFSTKYEEQSAYADERYGVDMAYTQKVHDRTAATLGLK